MFNIISILFPKGEKDQSDAFQKVRETVALNEEEKKYARSFRERSESETKTLTGLVEKFRADPSIETAEEIVRVHCQTESERAILNRLSEMAIPAIREKILNRTRPVLKAALEVILERAIAELKDSRERDAKYASQGFTRIAGSVEGTLKAQIETLNMESPATRALQAVIEKANHYLQILDTMKYESLHNPIQFVLGNEQQ